MKTILKIQYILWVILAAVLSSCSGDELPEPAPTATPGISFVDDKVIIESSLSFAEPGSVETRAMSASADLDNLHLYVVEFADNGDPMLNTLVGVHDAMEETVVGDEVQFKVMLTNTTFGRILHLIAVPSSVHFNIPFGAEGNIIPSLTVSDGNEAYWRRITFPNGYAVQTQNGEWVPTPELKSKLTRVPLIRNFCRVNVSCTDPSFTLLGFRVMNVAQQGAVAPWNSKKKEFTDFLDASGNPLPFATMLKNYDGYMPGGTFLNYQTSVTDNFEIPDRLNAQFLYERPVSRSNRSVIIVKGRYQGKVYYYKMDIGEKSSDGVFEVYPQLRNFQYNIYIREVKSPGMATALQAVQGPVYNNLSFDFDTESLLKISDGNELIQVNFTDLIITDQKVSENIFQYRYYSASDTTDYRNTGVSVLYLRTGDVIKSVIGPVDAPFGFRKYDLTFYPATKETKIQEFVVVKPSTGVGRTMRLILHVAWDYDNVKVFPGAYSNWGPNTPTREYKGLDENNDSVTYTSVKNRQGETATLFFDLPDDLPDVVFPLKFVLEVRRQNMENHPDGNMRVTQGNSNWPLVVGGTTYNQTVIKYEKTISLNNYISTVLPGDPDNSTGNTLMLDSITGRMVHRVSCRFDVTRKLTQAPILNAIHIEQPNYKPTNIPFWVVN